MPDLIKTKNSSCVQDLVTGFRKSSAHPAKSNNYNQILLFIRKKYFNGLPPKMNECLRSLNVKWNRLRRCRLFRTTTPQGCRCARFPCRTAGGITRTINSTLPSARMWDSKFKVRKFYAFPFVSQPLCASYCEPLLMTASLARRAQLSFCQSKKRYSECR